MNKSHAETYDRLRARLLIDKADLRTEIVEQPQLFFEAGRLAVQLAHIHELAREKQKGVTGDVKLRLQEESEKKLTVNELDALVEHDKGHLKARLIYKQTGESAQLAGVLKEAWSSRGYLLKELTLLEINEIAYSKERSDSSLMAQNTAAKKKKKNKNKKA